LPDIPQKNLLVEPQGKNTAPSLILATAAVYLQNPKAVVVALPADHLIKDIPAFLQKVKAGAEAAKEGSHLVTFGVPPSCPATGYGYIQFSKEDGKEIAGEIFFEVKKFKEKPCLESAREYLKAGNYFWNSGMFLWLAEVFPEKLKLYAPDLYPYWKKTIKALESGDNTLLSSVYEEIPSISIDYALMEKAKPVWMCRGDFGWSDVGAWSALADIWEKDSKQNALRGETLILDSKNCLLHRPGRFTALIGLKDLIIVDTEDALLICHKDFDQRVKDVVEHIRIKGKKDLL
jgi:mannose-1-phosphate guanylyltransferase